MSLPQFLTRIHNAAGPLLGGLAESELGERLSATSLVLEMDEAPAADLGQRAGYLLAANLGARLYPRLSLDAPADLSEEASRLAQWVNPDCEFGQPRGRPLTLTWRGGDADADRVTVAAENWNLALDGAEAATEPAAPPAAMAAAALGIGELFRALFADLLVHGRTTPAPFALSLITLGEPTTEPTLPESVELGEVHLAGCGAIGQAVAATLRELPVTGTLYAVDHDTLDEGNLQRYLLAGATDLGRTKPALIEQAFAEHPLAVEPVESKWGTDPRSAPGRETVLAALDTKQGRIDLQAGLPRELFNAWTQPADLGVSRHQAFGQAPCLACLAWPRHSQPSRSEMIAESLQEHELRVVIYLGTGLPVGQPLPGPLQGTRRLPLPEDAGTWTERSLIDDLIERFELPRAEFEPLGGLGIAALYHDAVCAGMLIEHGTEREAEISVPLAHQSALAGILLAVNLVVDRVPALRALRPEATLAKYDVLRGGEQYWPRPRDRYDRCICADDDFLAAHRKLWADAT
jgi:hypothetical protein